MLLETSPWLLAGLGLAGVVHAVLPRGLLRRHLGGRGPWPVVRASLLGVPLPLCSCGVIPVAAGLRRDGVGRGAAAAFTISTPQTGEESIPLTWALLGPAFAIARPVAAVVTAVVAGLLIDGLDPKGKPGGEPGSAGHGSDGAEGDEGDEGDDRAGGRRVRLAILNGGGGGAVGALGGGEAGDGAAGDGAAGDGLGGRVMAAARYGYWTLVVELAPWLAVGMALSALVPVLIPEGWIESTIGRGPLAMVAMLVVGVPLYVCATSSTPLAASLVAAGLSPGAAMVLLLAGPATNTATMAWVIKDLGWRALAIYLGVISVTAVGTGMVFDAAFEVTGAVTRGLAHGGHGSHGAGAGAVATGAAVGFTVLLGLALLTRLARALRGVWGARGGRGGRGDAFIS